MIEAIFKKTFTFLIKLRYRNVAIFSPSTIVHPEAKVLNKRGKEKIVLGSFTHLRGELFLFGHGGEITIGDYCYIGEYTKIWSAKKILIGNRVLIAHNVNIHDNNSHPTDLKERIEHFKKIITYGHPKNNINLNEKQIVIEDDVWIGFNSCILKGVTIGKGSIVAAASVVTKDVPPYSVVAGNPAKIVKYLENGKNKENELA